MNDESPTDHIEQVIVGVSIIGIVGLIASIVLGVLGLTPIFVIGLVWLIYTYWHLNAGRTV